MLESYLIIVQVYYTMDKKIFEEGKRLRVKRGRILNRKRRTKTDIVDVEAVVAAVRRAAIPRVIAPIAAMKYMSSTVFHEYIYIA